MYPFNAKITTCELPGIRTEGTFITIIFLSAKLDKIAVICLFWKAETTTQIYDRY